MKIIDLTILILGLNAAIDRGHKADWERPKSILKLVMSFLAEDERLLHRSQLLQ
jgi:hypothetical protein